MIKTVMAAPSLYCSVGLRLFIAERRHVGTFVVGYVDEGYPLGWTGRRHIVGGILRAVHLCAWRM